MRLKAFLNSPFLLCLYLSSPLCQHFSLFPSPSKSLLSLPSDSPFQLCLYPSFPFPPCLYLSTPSLSIPFLCLSVYISPFLLCLYLSIPFLCLSVYISPFHPFAHPIKPPCFTDGDRTEGKKRSEEKAVDIPFPTAVLLSASL